MHRTQISLDEWQYESLKSLAEREGRSMSDLVREAVSTYLVGDGPAALTALAEIEGIGEDPEASGRDHDRLLYGEGRERR